MSIFEEMSSFLQQGRAPKVKELVQQALTDGEDAKAILEDGLLSGMSIVGEKFKNNEVYVPEVLIAARAMNAGMEVLKPQLASADVEAKGKLRVGAPPNLPPGSASIVPIVSPFYNIRFPEDKGYAFVVRFEDDELSRVRFRVVKVT